MKFRDDLEIAFGTIKGPVRSDNQDDYLLYEAAEDAQFEALGRLIAVADGMGGQAGGAEASRLALRAFLGTYLSQNGEPSIADRLDSAFQSSCHAVAEEARRSRSRADMGTTLTAVVLDGSRLQGVHVGDSCCLLIRKGQMRLLTTMHVNPTYQHALTRVVGGGREDEEPERFSLELLPGDRLLLLSDGLWRVVDEKEVLHIVLGHPIKKAVEELLSLALIRNCPDNVTAVLVRWRGPDKPGERVEVEPVEASLVGSDRISVPGNRTWSRIWPFLLLIAGLVLGAVALFVL